MSPPTAVATVAVEVTTNGADWSGNGVQFQVAAPPAVYVRQRGAPGDVGATTSLQAHGVSSSGSVRRASYSRRVVRPKRAGAASSHGRASQMSSRAAAE